MAGAGQSIRRLTSPYPLTLWDRITRSIRNREDCSSRSDRILPAPLGPGRPREAGRSACNGKGRAARASFDQSRSRPGLLQSQFGVGVDQGRPGPQSGRLPILIQVRVLRGHRPAVTAGGAIDQHDPAPPGEIGGDLQGPCWRPRVVQPTLRSGFDVPSKHGVPLRRIQERSRRFRKTETENSRAGGEFLALPIRRGRMLSRVPKAPQQTPPRRASRTASGRCSISRNIRTPRCHGKSSRAKRRRSSQTFPWRQEANPSEGSH